MVPKNYWEKLLLDACFFCESERKVRIPSYLLTEVANTKKILFGKISQICWKSMLMDVVSRKVRVGWKY